MRQKKCVRENNLSLYDFIFLQDSDYLSFWARFEKSISSDFTLKGRESPIKWRRGGFQGQDFQYFYLIFSSTVQKSVAIY